MTWEMNLKRLMVRRAAYTKAAVRFVGITLALWCVAVAGLGLAVFAYGDQENAQPSDVIIVLGSGLRRNGAPGDALMRRSIWAARLYDQGLAPRVICTGGIGRGQTRSEASACRELLLERGVPDSAIVLEATSMSTEENAINAQQIMEANGWGTAVLVTDSFHMLRAQWIFSQQGISLTRSPVPRDWIRMFWYLRFSAREVIALQWQAFQDVLGLNVTRVDF